MEDGTPDSSPGIYYCTIAYNDGGIDPDNPQLGPAGGIVGVTGDPIDANPQVIGCILHQNGDDIRGCMSAYSCITDMDYDSAGQGNVYDDPQFIAGPMGNYYLSQELGNQPQTNGAICVDTGPDTWPFADTLRAVTEAPESRHGRIWDIIIRFAGFPNPRSQEIQTVPAGKRQRLVPDQDNAGTCPDGRGPS